MRNQWSAVTLSPGEKTATINIWQISGTVMDRIHNAVSDVPDSERPEDFALPTLRKAPIASKIHGMSSIIPIELSWLQKSAA
jgi:hypothetical protein